MKITEDMIKKSCSQMIYKRGCEYFKEGRVHLRKREDNLITAAVDGEELYNVRVNLSKDGIGESFCTCPYFETMGSTCKHIVAVLKQRKKEIDEGADFVDANDKIAKTLCKAFAADKTEKKLLHAKFIIYVTRSPRGGASYSLSAEIDGSKLSGIENFLECYIKGEEFKIDRYTVYTPGVTEFSPRQTEIFDILAEVYENRAADAQLYIKAAYRIPFSQSAAARIFPLLKGLDFSLVFDNLTLGAAQIREENPDIITDIDASEGEINLSVSDRGFALTRDGEWFLYENIIYHTDSGWRAYFMPVYNALESDGRTCISFKGDNTMLFAAYVLPALKNRRDVIMHGIDELIVNETPEFEVYFDAPRGGLRAVVKANYGTISLRLPEGGGENGKILVRDYEKEAEILSCFSAFAAENGSFTLYNDADIYDFLTRRLPKLREAATIYTSDSFDRLKIKSGADIRASVSYLKDGDLLETKLETSLSREQISGILSAVRLRKSFYRLPSGAFIDLEHNEDTEVLSLIDRLGYTYEDVKNGSKTVPKYHALYLSALDFVGKDKSFSDYINGIRNVKPKIPAELETVLRDYQKDGIEWMTQIAEMGLGGILADDMGLGKTLQIIAFIHGIKPDKPTLITAPSSLTYNWKSEIMKFTPDAKTLVIDGNKETRAALIKTVNDYEFVITSYPLLRRDIAQYSDTEFYCCVIDEAQHIKNAKTMNARSVKRINAKLRFALTGTPIENSLMELWSIFDFVIPDYLYSAREFRMRYELPLVKEGDAAAADSFRMRIRPFMLRRMKKDVLNELPEKIEYTMYAELTGAQKDLYMSYLALTRDKTLELLGEGGRGRIRILTLLMRLRQICCHPKLFDSAYTGASSKLDLLTELIANAIDAGHRVLVFSQFTSMLAIIQERLKENDTAVFYLDGQTPSTERTQMADRFNAGERDVFLISLKAGGLGLNLTGADTVIHYDPWWNPAVTDQASDRAYRIGQKKAVQVIRLAAKDTIEEKILRLQENKRDLADDIVRVNTDTFKSLSNEEIMALFN